MCVLQAKPKNCFLLEVRGNQFRLTSQRLRCVRPFLLQEVTLGTATSIDHDAPDAEAQISRFLKVSSWSTQQLQL